MTSDPIAQLAELLAAVQARVTVAPERIGRSPFYDLDYHRAMIACGFIMLAQPVDGRRRVMAPWLKLAQFAAMRPWLLPAVLSWQRDRKSWARVSERNRRGFLGDRTHDAVIDLYVATGALARDGGDLVEGQIVGVLETLYRKIVEKRMFVSERSVLERIRTDVPPVRRMLEGR